MKRVLVVDDDPAICQALSVLFDVHDVPFATASTPEEALARVDEGSIGLVIQDMNFTEDTTSGREGKALFRALRERAPGLPVVLMTAWTDVTTAVALVKEGAHDYIGKPWDDDRLVADVRALLVDVEESASRGCDERPGGSAGLAARYDLCGLEYASEAMDEVVRLTLKVAASDVPIAIIGPNGAGKEKIAQVIVANSRRRDRPFLTINMGGLPDDLLEAELFGAEAGAFTGAKKLRIGRFEAADGGTLFLDEIGNLSPTGQMKLLRVLQTGEFQRLGSNHSRTADVRIVSATNIDMRRAIAEGRFREDLYYRLNVIELRVPPLRERVADIQPLTRLFLREFASPDGAPWQVTDDAMSELLSHFWHGNVRELRNRVRRATLIAARPVIDSAALGLPDIDEAVASSTPATASAPLLPSPSRQTIRARTEADERQRIEAALVQANGVIKRAAALLGISRQALYRRIDKFGITLGRHSDES